MSLPSSPKAAAGLPSVTRYLTDRSGMNTSSAATEIQPVRAVAAPRHTGLRASIINVAFLAQHVAQEALDESSPVETAGLWAARRAATLYGADGRAGPDDAYWFARSLDIDA